MYLGVSVFYAYTPMQRYTALSMVAFVTAQKLTRLRDFYGHSNVPLNAAFHFLPYKLQCRALNVGL
jgi:hypothetical protein